MRPIFCSRSIGRRLITNLAQSNWPRPPTLSDATVEIFRDSAFNPARPHLFPKGEFASFPAAERWFRTAENRGNTAPSLKFLDTAYLSRFGLTTVPLELALVVDSAAGDQAHRGFQRADYPLSFFLDFIAQANQQNTGNSQGTLPNIYLAQCPISSLPHELDSDLPTPLVVREAGRGDIYDSSIWIGLAPTHTPLHKDPNPNLFVQLAGRKLIRLFEPAVGTEIYNNVQRQLMSHGSAAFRGEEMMFGPEKELLDEAVWGEQPSAIGYEAVLDAGDGIFVPKGWWHSVKGVGDGIIGSVCWTCTPDVHDVVLMLRIGKLVVPLTASFFACTKSLVKPDDSKGRCDRFTIAWLRL